MYRSSTIGRRGGRMLVLIALVELALAAGFWLILGSLPEAGGAMQATAAILGGVGVVLLLAGLLWMRRAAKKDRISSTGVAGTGQIMGLGQTGMTVNDQPQVELDLLVTIPGRSPYRVKVKEIVPLIMLNRLQGTLPVRVDPAEPNAVVIQWDQPNMGSATLGGIDLAELARSGTILYGGGVPGGNPVGGGQPGVGAGGPGGVDETLGQVAAALAATANPDAAWEWVRFLATPFYQTQFLKIGLWLPSQTALTTEEGLASWLTEGVHPANYRDFVTDYLPKYGVTARVPAGYVEANSNFLSPAIDAVANGTPPADVMPAAVAQANQVIAEANA